MTLRTRRSTTWTRRPIKYIYEFLETGGARQILQYDGKLRELQIGHTRASSPIQCHITAGGRPRWDGQRSPSLSG